MLRFTALITTDKKHIYIYINTEVWDTFYSKLHLPNLIFAQDWCFGSCEDMLPAVYKPLLLALSLSKEFCKITNFYSLRY